MCFLIQYQPRGRRILIFVIFDPFHFKSWVILGNYYNQIIYINSINNIINGIFEEANIDFGLFITGKITQKKFIEKANIFFKSNFKKNDKILGVHFRGSTYKTARGHAFPPTLEIMINKIEKLIINENYNKIMLVTEELEYLEKLKKKFEKKCIFYPSYRTRKIDAFKIYPRKKNRYKFDYFFV